MKKLVFYLLFICITGSVLTGQTPTGQTQANQTPDFLIATGTLHTDLVYKVNGRDGRLYQSYLGHKLVNISGLMQLRDAGHPAYATFGTDNLFEPAIRLTHNDGNPSLELKYVSHSTEKPDANTTITHILLKDPMYPVEVSLNIKTFAAEDVIEQWVEIVQKEAKPVTIFNYASSMLHFDANKYWLTQFHGDWAEEMKMQESELTSGIKIIDTKLGTRAHMYQTPVFFLSLNEKSDENTGELIAGTLGWSGNFQFLFEIDEKGSLRVISGINPFASEYSIQPGKVFKTPSFIFTYSNQGKGQASRNLHHWATNYGVLDGNGPRILLLNNWETTYFNFNEPKLTGLLDDTKKMGLDVFLLDDGWFANKYPRDNDRAGLGDWQENKAKLPDGLGYLVKEADSRGVKFGIWIEPEMVNPKSELYETHPDWVLKLPNRPEHYYRNQLVLDLTNPEVQEFVYNVVEGMLTKNPGIAFIKWDCNRMMTNAYSVYLKDKQSHLYIDYVNNLYSILDKLRQKYPHLPIMLCSGGGGRVDYGALRYFTDFWASDDTDPLERVYIQWGYSYFFPSVSVCNHITSWGKQSLKFKTDVAMMGKMGYDIPVNELTEKELKFSQDAIVNYKRLSDVIWHGDLYRLASPYEGNRAVLMYVNSAKTKSVLFAYTLNARYGESFNRVRLQGLDPAKTYKVQEINVSTEGRRPGGSESGRSYTGDYLMNIGLNAGSATPLSSAVYESTANAQEMLELVRREGGYMYQTHPRTKGSTGFPDKILSTEHFRDPRYLGAGWKAMPADLSSPRLGDRSFDLLDDLSNQGMRKKIFGEVDMFQFDHTHELYAHMNINYIKLDRLPSFDRWGDALEPLARGDFFTTTGEVLLPRVDLSKSTAGEVVATVDAQWTFPLRFAEIVWSDGKTTQRETIALTDTREFGKKTFEWRAPAPGWQWARVAVWDVAGNGAFVNPVWKAE